MTLHNVSIEEVLRKFPKGTPFIFFAIPNESDGKEFTVIASANNEKGHVDINIKHTEIDGLIYGLQDLKQRLEILRMQSNA